MNKILRITIGSVPIETRALSPVEVSEIHVTLLRPYTETHHPLTDGSKYWQRSPHDGLHEVIDKLTNEVVLKIEDITP